MDGFGLPKLLEAMHGTSKPEQKFASQVYEKILKINREIESDKVLEGEITPDEAQESIREMYEFNAIHERLVRLLPDSLASQLHKFTNPIRGAAIRNFVVNQVTRPKLGNSGSFRFRIWDKEMQQRTDKEGNTSLLAKNDNIFFLDEGWKDLRIKTDFGKQDYTLSELWDAVRNKETGIPLAKAKEVLNAVVVRTPMDSLSGAQVLEFRGFTGVKGVSGLMHPRKTRALGGADLDGDKAAVFFGDEVHGMRKEWKKMYKDQADEYVLKNGSEASNKGYYIFAIAKDATPWSDPLLLCSLSSTAPTMPAGYTYRSDPIWFISNNGSGDIRKFIDVNGTCYYNQTGDAAVVSQGLAYSDWQVIDCSVIIPSNSMVNMHGYARARNTSGAWNNIRWHVNGTDTNTGLWKTLAFHSVHRVVHASPGVHLAWKFPMVDNEEGFYYKWNANPGSTSGTSYPPNFYVWCRGWSLL
jgi:hypothetical protein